MARSVTIAAGKVGILLPDGGTYDAGKTVILTDDQFKAIRPSLIPGTIIDNGVVLSNYEPLAGIGDAIRVYNNVGAQTIPITVTTKVTVMDTVVNPASGWPLADYGDFSGGTTFQWDLANHRIKVLRNCIIQAFLNADCDAIDVPLVVQATGKQSPTAPYLTYTMRMAAGGSIQLPVDGVLVPATTAVGTGYTTGGGNAVLPPFNAKTGDFIELWMAGGNSAFNLIYADWTLRNIANTA